jgi:hypothetical protein
MGVGVCVELSECGVYNSRHKPKNKKCGMVTDQ